MHGSSLRGWIGVYSELQNIRSSNVKIENTKALLFTVIR